MVSRLIALTVAIILGIAAYMAIQTHSNDLAGLNPLNDIETAAFSGSLSKFADYSQSPMIQEQTRQMVTERRQLLSQRCEEITEISAPSQSIIEEIKFSGNRKHPVQGIWVDSYQLSACGQTQQVNIVHRASPESAPTTTFMLDGTSLAKPDEQADAIIHVTKASSANRLDCQTWQVTNTEFLGAKMDATDGSWEERWSSYGCGNTYDVLVTFQPNEQFGTRVHANILGKKI